jgi:hypothetical protein
VQGTSALRLATAKATRDDPSAISPKALKNHRELNLEQYLILKSKRFGHALNLRGHLSLPSGKTVNLEGFSEAFTVPMIASSFQKFVEGSDSFSAEDVEWIVNQFNQTTSSDDTDPDDIQVFSLTVQDPQFEGPISLGTGHHWHSTGTIFYGNYLIFCNRGSGDSEPGIHVYFLPDRSRLTDGTLWEMTKRQEVFGGDVFGLQRIVNDLGAQLVHYEQMDPQTVGNCTYTSMLCTLYSIMALRQISNLHSNPGDEPHFYTDPEVWHDAFAAVKPHYENFVAADQTLVQEDMFEEVEEWLDPGSSFGKHPLGDFYRNLMSFWKDQTRTSIPSKYPKTSLNF